MKTVLTILICLLLSSVCSAQITLGPRLGVNFSNQNLDSPYEVWKVGTLFGGVLNVPIKGDYSIQTEFLFSQKGYREEFDGDNSYDELTATYIEIPLYFNYEYSTGQINFFANAGLFMAYWKSGTYESKLAGDDKVDEDYEIITEYDQDGYKDNRIDYGPSIGLGILYDRIGTTGDIILEFRYSKGLAPISSLENPPPDYSAGKNSTFSISLAYMLYL